METSTITRDEFDQLVAVVQENNRLLKNMRKWGRVAFWCKVVIWTVVLVAPVLLYPYIASYVPGLPAIPGFSEATTSTNTSLFGVPSPAEIQEFLHPIKPRASN
jgi:hypothetical protein